MNIKKRESINYWIEQAKIYQKPQNFPIQEEPFYPDLSESSCVSLEVPEDRYSKIKRKAGKAGITMFAFLSGITIFELMNIKNVKSYSYAYPVDMANRVKDGEVTANLNTLINTISLYNNQTINEYFQEVQRSISQNLENSDIDYMSFSNVFSNDGNPLFDTLLNYDYKINPNYLNSEKVIVKTIESDKTRVPIEFYFIDSQHSMTIKILFDKRILTKYFIEEIKNHVDIGINRFLKEDLERNVLSLSASEIKTNKLKKVIDQEALSNVLESIASNAKKAPNKNAIEYGDTVVTYEELWNDTTSLAYDVKNKITGSRPKIIIDGTRDYKTIVNILAAWINKAVIIPVDGTQPLERIKAIAQISKPKYILGDSNNLSSKINIEKINATQSGKYDPATYSTTDNAYIYFTSGTTGEPKGILGWHGAISNFVHWEKKLISKNDRFMQLTKPFFDVYLRDILTPLVAGATIVIPSEDEVLLPEEAYDFINRHGITAMHIVPTLAQLWIEKQKRKSNKTIKIFFAGEKLSKEFLKRWFYTFKNSEVVNLYGPTEGTLAKFYYMFNRTSFDNEDIPVGRPITAANYYVCQNQGQRWYDNGKYAVGNILIASNYLTRGYLDDNADKQAFISDSLYNTGDLGYIDHHNLLHVVGRNDEQIKIDGVRIQPNEIVKAITSLPGISWSTVTFNATTDHLSAYLLSDVRTIDIRKVIEHLSNKLPSQFIPKDFYRIGKLQMKLNGKIDRDKTIKNAKLLILNSYEDSSGVNKITDETTLEKLIEKIFESELNLAKVNNHDNFFKIGGNSLKAAQTIGSLNSLLHVKISYRDFLKDSTPLGIEQMLIDSTIDQSILNENVKTIMEKLG